MNESTATEEPAAVTAERPQTDTVLALIFAISAAHLLNDTIQALLPSIYPILKGSYHLSFTQLGRVDEFKSVRPFEWSLHSLEWHPQQGR